MYYGNKIINGSLMYGGIKSNSRLIGDILIPEEVDNHIVEFLDDEALAEQKEILNVKMPDTIKILGLNVFYDSSIQNIYLSKLISEIPEWSFGYCKNINQIYIPDNVNSIGNFAFYDCENLTNIRIPDSVKFFGTNAFSHCHSLIGMDTPKDLSFLSDKCYQFCYKLKCIILHSKIKYIGNDAFRKCDNLTIVIDNNEYCVDYCKKNKIKYIERK